MKTVPVTTRRWWLSCGILASALAAAAAGCGGRPRPGPGEPVTIVFKHAKHPQAAALTALVERFEAEHPRIRVREEILPASSDEQHQFYVINLAAGADDFDVVDLDVIWVPEFARAGWLAPLAARIGDPELAPLHAPALDADRWGGELWAVPWFIDAGVLYYRRDLLQRYGFDPPATFPELADQARRILDAERDDRLTGFVWQGLQYEGLVCVALEFIHGNGGAIVRDGAPSVLEPATLDALRFIDELIRTRGVTPPLVTTLNEEAARHVFQSGRAIFMRNWPYAWPLLNAAGSPVAGRVGLAPVPAFPGHDSAPTLGGYHLGVNARSRHVGEAAAFVRFMIRPETQRQILLKMGRLPAHGGVYDDPAVRRALPLPADILPALARARPRPVTPYYMMISQILQPELSAIVAGIRTPERAMQLAAEQIARLVGT